MGRANKVSIKGKPNNGAGCSLEFPIRKVKDDPFRSLSQWDERSRDLSPPPNVWGHEKDGQERRVTRWARDQPQLVRAERQILEIIGSLGFHIVHLPR